jgi:hypothetical protein
MLSTNNPGSILMRMSCLGQTGGPKWNMAGFGAVVGLAGRRR